ncbi:MAG: hypothetical protein ACYC6G_11135 [Desulfobaccales bacterium]
MFVFLYAFRPAGRHSTAFLLVVIGLCIAIRFQFFGLSERINLELYNFVYYHGGKPFAVSDLLVLPLALVSVIVIFVKRLGDRLTLGVMVFFGILVWGIVCGSIYQPLSSRILGDAKEVLYTCAGIVAAVAFIRTREDWLFVFRFLLYIVTGYALLLLAVLLVGFASWGGRQTLYDDLLFLLPVIEVYGLFLCTRRRGTKGQMAVGFILVATSVFPIFLSFSKSLALGQVPILAAFLFIAPRVGASRLMAITVTASLVLASIAGLVYMGIPQHEIFLRYVEQPLVTAPSKGEAFSSVARIYEAINIWLTLSQQSALVLGLGFGSWYEELVGFTYVLSKDMWQAYGSVDLGKYSGTHWIPLTLFLKTGLLGALAYVAVCIGWLRDGFGAIKRAAGPDRAALSAVSIALFNILLWGYNFNVRMCLLTGVLVGMVTLWVRLPQESGARRETPEKAALEADGSPGAALAGRPGSAGGGPL